MPISLAGKTAIVTGAGRGIGKAVAEVFAREGAKVLVVNRSPEAGLAATDGTNDLKLLHIVVNFPTAQAPSRWDRGRGLRGLLPPGRRAQEG